MYFLFENSKFIKYFNKIFKSNVIGMTIFFLIFLEGEKENNLKVLNHEKIHIKQFQETFFVGFYLISTLDFFIKYCKYKNFFSAYKNILFEKEAYENMNNLDYLDNRKRFAWLKYITSNNKNHPE